MIMTFFILSITMGLRKAKRISPLTPNGPLTDEAQSHTSYTEP
jgi:hypothetical protein